ncbi:MAG: FKBP-type peptidyl-prolyl cis-trans isomerase [Bacteroidota bacterium]
MKKLLPILFLGLLFANCDDNNNGLFLSYDEQLEVDTEIIENYLTENGLTAEMGEFGLQYIIDEPGTGTDNPTQSSTVIVKYKGYLPNGDVFDEGDTLQTNLQSVISGWRVGIPLFKKGGKGTIFLPSSLGYGVRGSAGIPPNQVLIFDVELINFL